MTTTKTTSPETPADKLRLSYLAGWLNAHLEKLGGATDTETLKRELATAEAQWADYPQRW